MLGCQGRTRTRKNKKEEQGQALHFGFAIAGFVPIERNIRSVVRVGSEQVCRGRVDDFTSFENSGRYAPLSVRTFMQFVLFSTPPNPCNVRSATSADVHQPLAMHNFGHFSQSFYRRG